MHARARDGLAPRKLGARISGVVSARRGDGVHAHVPPQWQVCMCSPSHRSGKCACALPATAVARWAHRMCSVPWAGGAVDRRMLGRAAGSDPVVRSRTGPCAYTTSATLLCVLPYQCTSPSANCSAVVPPPTSLPPPDDSYYCDNRWLPSAAADAPSSLTAASHALAAARSLLLLHLLV